MKYILLTFSLLLVGCTNADKKIVFSTKDYIGIYKHDNVQFYSISAYNTYDPVIDLNISLPPANDIKDIYGYGMSNNIGVVTTDKIIFYSLSTDTDQFEKLDFDFKIPTDFKKAFSLTFFPLCIVDSKNEISFYALDEEEFIKMPFVFTVEEQVLDIFAYSLACIGTLENDGKISFYDFNNDQQTFLISDRELYIPKGYDKALAKHFFTLIAVSDNRLQMYELNWDLELKYMPSWDIKL